MKKLGFGLMRLPLLNKEDPKSIDVEQVCQMVDEFIENGFTYFDTAYMYHNHESELAVQKCLTSRYPRDKYKLASKLPTMFLTSEADNEKFFNEQLNKCKVEYFDYYLLHNLCVENYQKATKYNSFAFCCKQKEAGKIKHLGFSFHGLVKDLDAILQVHADEIEFVQLQINYIDWESPTVESRKCYETVKKYGKKIIVMEPVKGGTLANIPEKAANLLKKYDDSMSIPSYAIRFAASLNDVMMVLSGMSNLEQLRDNMSYMKEFKPLNEEEHNLVLKCADLINEAIKIPCTTCNYCTEKCPKHINIPAYFKLYNEAKVNLNSNYSKQKNEYQELTKDFGLASSCIKCHQCEKMCPQHLKITDYLLEVSKTFE